MDGFEDIAAVEAPSEGTEVARQMFGADHTMRGQQAVLDVGEHGVRPTKGGVARGGSIGAGDMAFVGDTRLLANTTKPLTTIADDRRPGLDTGTQPFGFAGLETAHDLQTRI